MANVSKAWIRENVDTLYAFGGQVTKEDVIETARPSGGIKVPRGGFETTLSQAAVHGDIPIKEKFHILIPGYGWADCFISHDEFSQF